MCSFMRLQVYIYVVLCLFTVIVYATSTHLGSPAQVYANLTVCLPLSSPCHIT